MENLADYVAASTVVDPDAMWESAFSRYRWDGNAVGTGDIYASAFVGAFVRGKSAYDAAAIAANYTVECIKTTAKLPNHWYGAAFEPDLIKLIQALQ